MAEHKLRALVSGLTPFFFNKSKDNTIEGHTYPKEASALDLGSATKPFRAIYADTLVGSGGSGGETVKVSAADPTAGYLEDKIAATSPLSLATSTDSLLNLSLNTSTLLLRSGANSLQGNLSVDSGVTIDGVDIGSPGDGLEISSTLLRVKRATASALEIISGGLAVNTGTTTTIISNQLEVDTTESFNWTVGTHTFNTAPQINSNLNFVGSSRSITTSTGDLTIDPAGTLYYPLAQNIQGISFSDAVTGIQSFRHFNHSGNSRQLTIGKIKADELYVRVFTADEERVNRGAEFWARSYGIVETSFTIPAEGSNVDVWFEEAPGLPGLKLFLPDNWIMFRTVDIDTGLTVMKVWFKVVDAGADDYISREDVVVGSSTVESKMSRQQWRLKHMSGGTPTEVIKKGNVGVDFGIAADFAGTPAIGQFEGQGVVALSALSQDSGPYIQIQTFDTVTSDEPVFLNRVRMGNLDGVLGYDRATEGEEIFGFAAGNNLATDPDTGDFTGFIVEPTNGLRMYNANIRLFDGADDTIYLNPTIGLGLQVDSAEAASNKLYISWYKDLADSDTYASPIGRIGTWGSESNRVFQLRSFGSSKSSVVLDAVGDNGIPEDSVASLRVIAGGSDVSRINLDAFAVRVVGALNKMVVGAVNDTIMPVSRLHVYDETDDTGEAGGLIIEQAGTGDSMLHWLVDATQWFTAGIDQSDGKWKLTAHNFLADSVTPSIIIDPSDGKVTINGLDLSSGDPISGLTSTDGSITIVASDIVVNSAMYVPTGRTITAGSGLTGGGNLTANRSLAVDFSLVASTGTTMTAGNGLTGGGTLASSRTFDVGAGDGITVNINDVQINFGYSPTWTGTHQFNVAPNINANLNFIGGSRTITGSDNIILAPDDDLIFTPAAGDVILTTSKIFKSSDYNTTSAGITGFAFFNNGSGNKQLDIDTIKADQLRAQTFVAESTRVEVGDEYWGKSMGILHDNFTTPSSIGGTVSVYFEDSPAFSGALFANSDWILLRTLTSAGAANEFWGQVTAYAHQGNDSDGRGYQRWTFTLRSGATNTVIKRGNVAVGFGAAGQGYVHLTTLTSKNGPWIGIGKWGGSNPYDGVSDTMNVRMGNLNGSAGIAVNDWGFVTGNNIALTPSTGFSGVVSSATDGVKLYNTDISLYDGADVIASLTQALGLKLALKDSATLGDSAEQPSAINWFHDDGHSAWINSGLASASHTIMDIATLNSDSLATSEIRLTSYGHSGDIVGFPAYSNTHTNIRISSEDDGYIFLGGRKTIAWGNLTVGWYSTPDVQGDLTIPTSATATLHVKTPTSGVGFSDQDYGGILVEDGALRFENTGAYVTMGIDPSDGYNFIVSYADDYDTPFITFNPTTGVTTIAGLDGTAALGGVTAGTGITIAGASIAVNSSVVRTDQIIYTDYGLIGGDDLSGDIHLEIDTSVVVINTRTLTAGAGLTGGGTLAADRTFAVGAGSGITVNADDVAINLAATSGLNLTSGLAIDDSIAGAGLTITSKVLNVIALSTGGLTVNANDIQIKLPANSGLTTDSTGLYLPSSLAGTGLSLTTGVLSVNVSDGLTTSGDNIIIASSAAGAGLAYASGVLSVNASTGLSISGDNVILDSSAAGSGLAYSSGVLSVSVASGLSISGDNVILSSSAAGAGMTYSTGVLNVIALSTGGLTVNADDIQIKLPTNSGLITDSTGLYIGTPTALTATTTNAVTTTTHTHAVTASSDVGTSPSASLLKSTASGGLTLGVLDVRGTVNITNNGDLTVGTNIFFVDYSQANVGINCNPDSQFALDVNGPIRGTELIGSHAIQLSDVALLCHFDGGWPYETNFTGEPNAIPLGQVPNLNSNVHYRPGKFYKAMVVGKSRTNLATNPSFETNLTGWTTSNGAGGDMAATRDTADGFFGSSSAKLTWTTVNNSQFYHAPVASSTATGYSFGLWMKALIPCSVTIQIQRDDSPFTSYGNKTVSVTEDWQYFYVSATAAGSIPLRVNILPAGSANTVWVDGVQLEQAAQPSWYIDGSLGTGYAWTGTAHASTSTRTNGRLSYNLTNMVNHRWTLMAWACWPYDTAPSNNAFCRLSLSNSQYVEVYPSGSALTGAVASNSGTTFPTFKSGAVTSAKWYHIAIVYTPGLISFYTDGVLTWSAAYTFSGIPTGIQVGAIAGPQFGDLMCDDLVVSRQALSADRVRAIYESDAPVFAESSSFHFRATQKGLVWADEEGLWMLNSAGDEVLGVYGGESTKSWGGLTLSPSDFVLGDSGRGAFLLWDDSAGTLQLGKTGATTTNLYLSGTDLSFKVNSTERVSLTGAGVLTINDSGGAAVFTFNASAGAEFTKPLTLATTGGIYQGSGTFSSPTTGLKIFNSSGVGKISGYNSGVEQVTFDTDGKLKAGAGKTILDSSGIQIVSDTTSTPTTSALRFTDGSSTLFSEIRSQTAANANSVSISVKDITNRSASVFVSADADTARVPTIQLQTLIDGTPQATLSLSSSNGAISLQQPRSTGTLPVLSLSQIDVSEPMIDFLCTSGAGNGIDTAALGAYSGKIKVVINGVVRYIPYYA